MQKVKSQYGPVTLLVASREETIEIKVYAQSILRAVETIKKYPKAEFLQSLELESLFQNAQAIADFSKAAAKRLGRKPRRHDQFNLVEKASETVDLT